MLFPVLPCLVPTMPGTRLWVQLLPHIPEGWLMYLGARCQPWKRVSSQFWVLIEKKKKKR